MFRLLRNYLLVFEGSGSGALSESQQIDSSAYSNATSHHMNDQRKIGRCYICIVAAVFINSFTSVGCLACHLIACWPMLYTNSTCWELGKGAVL